MTSRQSQPKPHLYFKGGYWHCFNSNAKGAGKTVKRALSEWRYALQRFRSRQLNWKGYR